MSDTYKVIFFGTPEFSVPTLLELIDNPIFEVVAVVTQPDRPSGRGQKLEFSPVKKIALEHNLPILQANNIRKEEDAFLKELNAFSPVDIGVVIAFGQILPQSVLDFPNHGCINLHASLLPRWRGAAPIQQAILAGDKETGVCLMKMEAGLDTGPYYSLIKTEIKERETAGSLHDRLSQTSAQLAHQDLAKIIKQELNAISQNDSEATHAHKPNKDLEKINWDQDAIIIDRSIRALSPFPGTYANYQQKRIKILNCTPSKTSHNKSPGTVIFCDKTRLEIACGEGSILIESVKPEGKRQMSVQDFLQGIDIEVGDQFT